MSFISKVGVPTIFFDAIENFEFFEIYLNGTSDCLLDVKKKMSNLFGIPANDIQIKYNTGQIVSHMNQLMKNEGNIFVVCSDENTTNKFPKILKPNPFDCSFQALGNFPRQEEQGTFLDEFSKLDNDTKIVLYKPQNKTFQTIKLTINNVKFEARINDRTEENFISLMALYLSGLPPHPGLVDVPVMLKKEEKMLRFKTVEIPTSGYLIEVGFPFLFSSVYIDDDDEIDTITTRATTTTTTTTISLDNEIRL
ncbi:hypothetical protein SNEBB_000195 [Seison nebaliae]|nr:hypothetical protein SNEBB_000195 [Seison nebaliae]